MQYCIVEGKPRAKQQWRGDGRFCLRRKLRKIYTRDIYSPQSEETLLLRAGVFIYYFRFENCSTIGRGFF